MSKVTIPITQEINKLYDAGESINQIAIKLNLSDVTIYNYVWKPRIHISKRFENIEVKNKIVQEINELYNKGFEMIPIAKKLKVSYSTVQKYVLKPRGPYRNYGPNAIKIKR